MVVAGNFLPLLLLGLDKKCVPAKELNYIVLCSIRNFILDINKNCYDENLAIVRRIYREVGVIV